MRAQKVIGNFNISANNSLTSTPTMSPSPNIRQDDVWDFIQRHTENAGPIMYILAAIYSIVCFVYLSADYFRRRKVATTYKVLGRIMEQPKGEARDKMLLEACADVCEDYEADFIAPLQKGELFWNDEVYWYWLKRTCPDLTDKDKEWAQELCRGHSSQAL